MRVAVVALFAVACSSSTNDCPKAPNAGCTMPGETATIHFADGRSFAPGDSLTLAASGHQDETCIVGVAGSPSAIDCTAPPPTKSLPDFIVRMPDASTVKVQSSDPNPVTFTVVVADPKGNVLATRTVAPVTARCGCGYEDAVITIP